MPTSKELREKRAPLAVRIREMADLLTDDHPEFNSEERTNWEQLNKDYNVLTTRIQTAEQAEAIEGQQRDAAGNGDRSIPGLGDVDHRDTAQEQVTTRANPASEEQRSLAMQAWFRVQSDMDLTPEHQQACRAVGLNPAKREFVSHIAKTSHVRRMQHAFRDGPRPNAEQRALSAVSGSAGAYTVPDGFINNFELALLAFGGMREAAEVMRTNDGADLPWPTADDTSNTGALIAENTTVSEQDVTVGQILWKAYKYTSKLIKVPVELLEDTAFDLAAVLGEMLGMRIARITNTHYTTGNAANKPNGIVTASALGKTTASATAITGDEIIDLVHSVDPAYRVGARFMFHDNILLYVRKLKDGNGQYLWASGLNGGVSDTLWGYPYTINQDMQSSVATATKTMLFGQTTKYKIRDVREIRMRRLVERFADTDQEGFVAFMRTDGNLLDAGTNPVKHMLQA